MAAYGSPEYKLTWKRWVLPSGRSILALRASAPRTSGKGSTGWPTPRSSPSENRGQSLPPSHGNTHGIVLSGLVVATAKQVGGWPTPSASDATGGKEPDNWRTTKLRTAVQRSGWQTPTTNDERATAYSYDNGDPTKPRLKLLGEARAAAGWSTPTAGLHNIGERLQSFESRRQRNLEKGINGNGQGTPLGVQVKMVSGWATPSARDWRSGKASQETLDHNARPLNEQVVAFTPCGKDGSGSSAPTESSGVLHPAFPFSLLGLPLSFLEHCPPPATRSRRRSPRSSSSRAKKRASE